MEVDGISVAKAQEIENASVVSGFIAGGTGHLILETRGGSEIDAGLVVPDTTNLIVGGEVNPGDKHLHLEQQDGGFVDTGLVALTLLDVYPVGAIYMSVVDTNPGTLFGGEWTAWGSGRVPVGVDAAQTEFNTVEETGGEKTHVLTDAEMPSHSHTIHHAHETTSSPADGGSSVSFRRSDGSSPVTNFALVQQYLGSSGVAGSDTAHNNLQPYITCYMWKRTS